MGGGMKKFVQVVAFAGCPHGASAFLSRKRFSELVDVTGRAQEVRQAAVSEDTDDLERELGKAIRLTLTTRSPSTGSPSPPKLSTTVRRADTTTRYRRTCRP